MSRSTTPTPPPPKCHTDTKHGNLSMDVTPYLNLRRKTWKFINLVNSQ